MPADADEPPAAAAVAFRRDSRSLRACRTCTSADRCGYRRAPRELAPPPPPIVARVPPAIAAGHQLLWMAALSRIPHAARIARHDGSDSCALAVLPCRFAAGSGQNISRWSADGWLLWRRGGRSAPAGRLLNPAMAQARSARWCATASRRPARSGPLSICARPPRSGSGEREAALGLSRGRSPACRVRSAKRGSRSTPGGTRCGRRVRRHRTAALCPAAGPSRRGLCPGGLCRRQMATGFCRWPAAGRPPAAADRPGGTAARRRQLGRGAEGRLAARCRPVADALADRLADLPRCGLRPTGVSASPARLRRLRDRR